jgi:hypothetical protein
MRAIRAFREAWLTTGVLDEAEFSDPDARRFRYEVYWALYENSAYRNIHPWATKLKADYGLYKFIRSIFGMAFELGEFWRIHLMGGALDPAAGDGGAQPSCLPILTDNEGLRDSLATLWQSSNWATRKDVLTLWGAVMGDVGVKVIDDPTRGQVYLDIVHPGLLAEVATDAFGNVKGYTLEDERPDPRPNAQPGRAVVYTEIAGRDGDTVTYRTLLNGQPHAWNPETGAEWSEPYGFVPLVLIQHNNVGLSWGWSELHPALSKVREVDDLASVLGDQIRKIVNPVFAFIGARKTEATLQMAGTAATPENPEAGRQDIPALYLPANASVTPLIANLDIAGASGHLAKVLAAIEGMYPELTAEKLRLQGGLTGRALELAQQPAISKALQRRAGYDHALVRAQQMAVAIGGFKGYEGYAGFGLDSYGAGQLEHSIGGRPVFNVGEGATLDDELIFWQAASAAVQAGLPLEAFLRRRGWSDADLAQMGTQRQAAIALEQEDVIPEVGQ